MKCTGCGARTRVTDSRMPGATLTGALRLEAKRCGLDPDKGQWVARRHECSACEDAFVSIEMSTGALRERTA